MLVTKGYLWGIVDEEGKLIEDGDGRVCFYLTRRDARGDILDISDDWYINPYANCKPIKVYLTTKEPK